MIQTCLHCHNLLPQKQWCLHNLFKWHVFCPICKARIYIFRKKSPKETWRLIGSMFLGFALYKLIGQSLSMLLLAYLTKRIPLLKWFWLNQRWLFVLVTILISYLVFRLMYLLYIYKLGDKKSAKT